MAKTQINCEENITAFNLFGVASLLAENKLDANDFYKEFGLLPTIEKQEKILISFATYSKIINKLRGLLPFQHPALKLAKYQLENLHKNIWMNLFIKSPNLNTAFITAIQYRYIFSQEIFWSWDTEGGYTLIRHNSFTSSQYHDNEHVLHSVARAYKLMLQVLSPRRDNICSVSLIQKQNTNDREIEHYFSCPVLYEQDFNGFIIKNEKLYLHNKAFNKLEYNKLLKQVIEHPVTFPNNQLFSESVKCLIVRTLCSSHCNIEDISTMLKIHVRTLQSRLDREKLTFKRILNDVRANIAKQLLSQNGVSLSQISIILGYSEPSAFTRSFKAEHGISPRSWRQRYIEQNNSN